MADFSITEEFGGGLVTAKDPALLAPSELAKCDHAIYRYNSPGLFGAPAGVAAFTSLGNAVVTGLQICQFDNGTGYVVIQSHVGIGPPVPSYKTAPLTNLAAAFTTLEAVTEGNQLVAVPYNNKYYLFNGANANRVLKEGLVVRSHGLNPVTEKASVKVIAGTWVFGTEQLGWFEYWITEVVKDAAGTDILESDTQYLPDLKPNSVHITAVTQAVLITRHGTLANSNATHWRVYRGVNKTYESDVAFPDGVMIAEIPIRTDGTENLTFTDGVSSSVGFNLPTGTASTSFTGLGAPDLFALPDRVKLADGLTSDVLMNNFPGAGNESSIKIGTFGLTGTQDPISGMEVEVKWLRGGVGWLMVALSIDGGVTFGTRRQVLYTGAGLYVDSRGGPTDNAWGVVLTPDGLSNANFYVQLTAIQGSNTVTYSVSIDYVKVKAYYNGTPISTGIQFPAIQVDVGVGGEIGKNGKPPISSTGDVFQSALVMNDVSKPSYVWWSASMMPDSVPKIYFQDFETPDNDQVTCIKALGNRCMVGLRNSLWRINYLPTEVDASFEGSQGNAFDLVDPACGIVGPLAACLYTGTEGRSELAFMSATGLRTSDGFTSKPLCEDLDWVGMMTPLWSSGMKYIQLLNNPDNFELIMLFPVYNQGVRWLCKLYHFNYHPQHMKANGQLKASGPVTLQHQPPTIGTTAVDMATTNLIPNRHSVLFWGTVSDEDATVGYTSNSASATSIVNYPPDIRSRVIYAAGMGNEWRIKEVCRYVANVDRAVGVAGLTWTGTSKVQGIKRDSFTGLTDSIPFSVTGGSLSKVTHNRLAEGIQIGTTITAQSGTGNDLSLPFMIIKGESYGDEDSAP